MRKYISYILATALLFVCCAKTEVGLDESEVLVVSTNNIELDCDANEVTVLVNSLSSYSVSCDVGWREWVTASAMKGASGKTKIKFSFAQNNTVSPRNATITIENSTYGVSETISVSQEAGAPFIKSSVTEISADVERFTTKIDVDSNIDYTISSSEKWCHLNRTSGKSGKTTLDITIDANTDTLARKATITLENKEHKITKTVSVSQGAFNPVVTVETERLEFAAEGGEKHVEINANCDYKATTDADWLSVEQTSTGIKVTALSYVEVTERTADIAITNTKYNRTQTIKVSQGAFKPVLTVEQATLNFTSDGGTKSAVITANIDYEVTENADWLTVEQTSTGIKVTALSYAEVTERTADITITNTKYSLTQTIKVAQSAFKPVLTAEQPTLHFTSDGGTKSATITANIDYQVTETADWLMVEQTATGVKVTALSYAEVTDRTADITINNTKYSLTQTIKVTQGAFKPVLTAEQATLNFTSDGGTKSATITANIDYQVTENADWLTVEQTSTGLNITALPNEEEQSRIAEINITNAKYSRKQTIKVTQAAFVPILTVESTNLQFSIEGGPKSVAITSNLDYQVTKTADWLTIEKSGSGITISASAYTGDSQRAASVVVSNEKYSRSQTVNVIQFGIRDLITFEPNRVIVYTSSNNSIVTPYNTSAFGAKIVYNRYIDGNGYIIFEQPITSIGSSAFHYRTSLTNITIPDSVTSIGERAFYYCNGLTSIVIPGRASSIGDYAFEGCSSLKSVTIPDSVTSIGNRAFYRCSSLISITIPSRITSINDEVFSGCSKMTSITIPNSVTEIGSSAFSGCGSLTSIKIPNGVTVINYSTFSGCSSLTSITIPAGVTWIRSYAFSGCAGLTSITIPNKVTSIDHYAFSNCSSLTKITIPDSVTSIGDNAFYYCSNLTSIMLPDSITSIEDCTFYKCSSLKSITIPDSVTSVGYQAFYNCNSLSSVYCKPTTPPTGYLEMFADNASDRIIYVPSNSVNAYKSASGWRAYADYIFGYDFESGTVVQSNYEIWYRSKDGAVVNPYSTAAFNATIISNTYKNGQGVIKFDKEISLIGDDAFDNCSSLTSITIPESVTLIGDYAFYNCSGLTSITIPDSVSSVGSHAFYCCSSLASVYCKATTPPTGGLCMFDTNASGRKIYVPSNSVSEYKKAKNWGRYDSYIVGYNF